MSGVEALALPGEPSTSEPVASLDDVLSGVYDRINTNNGSDRSEDGKFTSPNPEQAEEPVQEEADESALEGADGGEGAEPASSTPTELSVPLPPNMRGKEELWNKIPAEHRAELASFQNEQHTRLTEQGRQIAASKPLMDAVNEFRHLFDGKIDPVDGIRNLAAAQQGLENPQTRFQTIMSIVDSYGARDQFAAILTGRAQMPNNPIPQPKAPDIESVVSRAVDERLTVQTLQTKLDTFATANPVWGQLSEGQQIKSINAAKLLLDETASPDAVLKKALNLAIEDNPALKAQVAPAVARPPVAIHKPSPEAIKRANSVNAPSTSTGKVKQPSLDDMLGNIYDKNHRG